MKLKLSRKPYQTLPTEIGEIAVCFLSAGDQDEFRRQVGDCFESQTAEQFAYSLFPFICWPADSLENGTDKPTKPVLTSEDIKKLNGAELNDIAGIYLDHNKDLNYKSDTVREQQPDGSTVVRTKYEQIEYPRLEGESQLEYLRRTFVLRTKEYDERLRRQMKELTRSLNFSQGINEQIVKTLAEGAQLKHMTDALGSALKSINVDFLKSMPIATVEAPSVELPRLILPPVVSLPDHIDCLSDQISRLIEINSQANNFMVAMNKTQTTIANEIKKSGDSTKKLAQWNLWIGGAVLFIAIVGLGWSLYSSWSTARSTQVYLEEAIKTLHSIDHKTAVQPAAPPSKPVVPAPKAQPKK